MRRIRRIPLWVGTAFAGAAVGAAVAVLVMAGAHTGGTTRSKLTLEQRLQAADQARVAALEAEDRAKLNAELRLSACHPGRRISGTIPRERYSAAVWIAEKYLGVPYIWGGASPRGFDSSGLVKYVYSSLGVSLPHYSVLQYCSPNAVHPSRSELRPGDLVFFDGRGHVGIYIGSNEFIDAPHTGAVVRIESLTGSFSRKYDGATRILS